VAQALFGLGPILLQKSFSADERIFPAPLVRSPRGDVRETTSFRAETTTDRRIDLKGPCGAGDCQKVALRDIFVITRF
jgi:hypothetical protein